MRTTTLILIIFLFIAVTIQELMTIFIQQAEGNIFQQDQQ